MGVSEFLQSKNDQLTQEFLRLLNLHDRSINGYIFSLVPSLSDADEIAQETRLRLWQQFDQYDRSKDFGAWARTIAYYQVRSFRTRVKRDRLRFSQGFLDVVAAEIESRADEIEARQHQLIECLSRLSPKARELIRYYYGTKGNLTEVARKFNRTLESTKKSLVRSRQALRACVARGMSREAAL